MIFSSQGHVDGLAIQLRDWEDELAVPIPRINYLKNSLI